MHSVRFPRISVGFPDLLEGFLTFGQASMGLILNNYAATDGQILKFFGLIFFFGLVAIIFVSSTFLAGRDHEITVLMHFGENQT